MINGETFCDELRAVLRERRDQAELAKEGLAAAWSQFMFPCLVEVAERTGLWWASSAVPSAFASAARSTPSGERREYLWDLTLFSQQGPGSGDWGLPVVVVEHENAWSEAAFRVDHWKTLCAHARLRVAIGYARYAEQRELWVAKLNADVENEHWTFPSETEDLVMLGFGGMTAEQFAFYLREKGAATWTPVGAE